MSFSEAVDAVTIDPAARAYMAPSRVGTFIAREARRYKANSDARGNPVSYAQAVSAVTIRRVK